MKSQQLKCKETGKTKYVSRCMRKECKNLVVDISFNETWRLTSGEVKKVGIKTKFKCIPD
jgi:hypothetical protein